jgi:hypothetical protein
VRRISKVLHPGVGKEKGEFAERISLRICPDLAPVKSRFFVPGSGATTRHPQYRLDKQAGNFLKRGAGVGEGEKT